MVGPLQSVFDLLALEATSDGVLPLALERSSGLPELLASSGAHKHSRVYYHQLDGPHIRQLAEQCHSSLAR